MRSLIATGATFSLVPFLYAKKYVLTVSKNIRFARKKSPKGEPALKAI